MRSRHQKVPSLLVHPPGPPHVVRGVAAGCVVALAMLLSPAVAYAQPAEAGAAFDRGVSFFRDGDYEAAMVEFKKAHELDPNWRVLYNLGQTSRELRDYAAALTSFERYLSEGGQAVEADRKAKVEGWIEELKGKVATLRLEVDVADAEVAIDDITVGKTPLKAVVVNAGRRKVSITKPGYAPLTRFVDVAGTERKNVTIQLSPLTQQGGEQKPDESRPSPLAPNEQPEGASPWPWAAFGITAAAGTVTAVLGGLSLSKKATFEEELEKVPNTATAIDAARDDARTFAIAADVMGGVTIAGAIVTIVGFAVEGSKGTVEREAKAPVRWMVGPGHIGVRGSF
ncbi:MAG: PEGA domain-containing protein [Myxococcales bacterium]|nr:PEGA domain-containing protein [Myxococcales bacterium]